MGESVLEKLLGDKLCGKNGDVKTADIEGEGKTVGLYFSAHWCPPCRGFTPKLADFYKKHHGEKKFEIVFVSSDKNKHEFEEYYGQMPWLALPYADRNKKELLSQKFKVSGIPTLVLLDGKCGKEITKEGRGRLLDDPEGEQFPWKPKTVSELFKDINLINNKGEKKSFADLSGKVIGYYFSAHWCPPCRAFTPKLIESYKKLVSKGKPFEIIFVSSDRGQGGFDDYFKDMPWLAIPFGEDKIKKEISTRFSVQGIPTLILLDEKEEVISTNGRGCIANDPEGEAFPWKLKPLNVLNEMTVSTINEEPCLIYFTDGEEASIKSAKEIITPVAEQLQQDCDSPVVFFYSLGDDTSDSLRDFIDISEEDDNILVILDIPSQKLYVAEDEVLSREAVRKFVTDFAAGKLDGKKLRR